MSSFMNRVNQMNDMKSKWEAAGAKCSNCDKGSYCSDRNAIDMICPDYQGPYRGGGDNWRRG